MNKTDNVYCRFCAEHKSSEKLFDLNQDIVKLDATLKKLTFLNAIYVDVSNQNSLPRTVCFVCYDSLNKAYDFMYNVKKAQTILTDILTCKLDPDDTISDHEIDTTIDDFLPSDSADEVTSNVKQERSTKHGPECSVFGNKNQNEYNGSYKLEVKEELKEEFTDAAAILEAAFNNARDNDGYEPSINVQDILDAAICSNTFPPNVTIYAKELSSTDKKATISWKDYPWICGYCNIEFQDINTLRSHSKVVHRKCSAYICVDCKKFDRKYLDDKYDNFHLFLDHVRKHRKSLRIHCHYCDEFLEKKENLNFHLKQHFVKSQLPCPCCGEILKNEECLQKHLREYKNVKPKRKPRRKRGVPITLDDLTCKLCQKVYKNPNSLRDHMKLHTTDRKRNYTCDRCGKMFFNKGTLTSHIMSHDKIRPHICKICNKSFLFPNMLRRHVLMHTNVKPFSCEQCGRCFRLQYQLNAHKIIHTDAMPYVCQYCNKAFRFKQILKNHERQHTGAKPYSCQQCGMEFTNWSNYNKHMKRRHNTDTSKKKITPEGVFPVNPVTGQIMQVEDPVGTEEWKTKIMVPGKRGKKKVIKEEKVS